MKKELQTVDVDSPLLVYDEYMIYLVFNTYELKYNDEDIEKQIKETVEESLKKRTGEQEEENHNEKKKYNHWW